MAQVATHCPYCALQCGMTLRQAAGGRVDVGTRDFPTNRGGLCQKGWTAAELLDHPDRLRTPLLHGEPVAWPVALDFVAGRIRELQAAHGRDALADLGRADTLLLVGGNVAETMPPLGRYLTEQAEHGTLIVIDPRRTLTAGRATLHLQPTPGTDLAIALGLLHIAVAEGYVDRPY